MFQEGTSFWVNCHRHLFFVISDPAQDPQNVVHVNITSLRADAPLSDPYNDRSCVLEPGEHPCITATSCVNYGGAEIGSVAHLTAKLRRREIKFDVPASREMLAKMRYGATITEHIIPIATDHLYAQRLV